MREIPCGTTWQLSEIAAFVRVIAWHKECSSATSTYRSPPSEEDSVMLATILVHVPLAIAPLMSPPLPPPCELDVLTPMAIEERSLGEFNHRIEAYLTLRRRIARTLPPSEMFDDEDPFVSDELRSALVAARPGARTGEFFTPGAERSLRQRIDLALAYVGGSALPFLHDEGTHATVNGPLPIMPDLFAWAPVLAALPPLPEELAFVIVGRDLALIDLAANLVIDVMSDAVPAWPGPDVIYR
jgi:hypothetical protein